MKKNIVEKNIKKDIENILRFQPYYSVKEVLNSIHFLKVSKCNNKYFTKYKFSITIYDSEKKLLDEAFKGSNRLLVDTAHPAQYVLVEWGVENYFTKLFFSSII